VALSATVFAELFYDTEEPRPRAALLVVAATGFPPYGHSTRGSGLLGCIILFHLSGARSFRIWQTLPSQTAHNKIPGEKL
jgi:hypothetical protein